MIAREPVSQVKLGQWRPYSSYQKVDSEWFGEIPAHWEAKRLKFVAQINPSKSEIVHLPGNIEVSFLPMEAIGDDGTLSLEESRSLDQVWQGYTYFRDQDVIVAKITPCFENKKGALCDGLVNGIGFGTTELHVLRSFPSTDAKFLFYLTVSESFRNLGTATMYGAAGQKRVSDDFIRDFIIAFPPLEEQRAITTFLDRETARVDRLIAAKERLIALLQEKRAALISHAVTKGLDPNVSMKDSGIEWLGEIPVHWEVKRLKFIAQVRSGVAKGRDLSGRLTIMMPYLRVANVQAGFLDLSDVAEIEVGVDEIERYSLQPGDVLMNEGGDYDKLGRGTVWYGQIAPCLHQNHVFSVRPNNADASEWIATVTLADYAKHYFILKSKQSTNLASISSSNLQDLPIVMPPSQEQQAILSFIRTETDKIDRLINKIAEGNVRLDEFHSALITAAVTGKINVSNILAATRPTKSQTANVHFRRAVFAAEIVAQLHQEPTFGHVKFQKLLFLAEKTCKVDIGSQYHRAAAGPYDNRALRSIDKQLQEQKWFEVRRRKSTGYYYAPMTKAGGHREYFNRYYPDIADRLQRLIDTFRSLDTERCEIVATLYGAWQDLLAEQSVVTDGQIVHEVLHNWHESKQHISEERWYAALKWMRETNLTPDSA